MAKFKKPEKKSVKKTTSPKGVKTVGVKKPIVKKAEPAAKPVQAKSSSVPTPAPTVHKMNPVLPARPVTPIQPVEPPRPQSVETTRSLAPVPPVQVTLVPLPRETAPRLQDERAPVAPARIVRLRAPIIVKEYAAKLSASPSELISKLIKIGIFANINQSIPYEAAAKVAADFGFKTEKEDEAAPEKTSEAPGKTRDASKLVHRPPIVTLMGHVDHGKTSLLDSIRKTQVAAGETGGITQHIGAYEVFLPKGAVTFLDTPGHEAFTEMRARGAKVTDLVVLVVAADDGIMPQTEEAIDHARAADATIVVAINKTDLPSADIERVKKGLAQHNLLSEDWGGKTITVAVSAKTGKGIDQLLEMLLLESELLDLKADPQAPASGIVIEAKLSKGSGPVATVLIKDGTLHIGDAVVCGKHWGRVKSMLNDRGERLREAPPSMPVEISGLGGVPRAGDSFYAVESEVKAKSILEVAIQKELDHPTHVTLEEAYTEIRSGHMKALKLIVKSDVQGSLEALKGTLTQIPTKDVQLQIIHSGIGNITKSDVMLAAASNAVVIGFHVELETDAEETAKIEKVDARLYQIIYEVRSAIEKAMSGLLVPERKEILLGIAEVRQLFKVSKIGLIAGSMIVKGKVVRNALCRVMRGGKKILDSKVSGLKRFKDDVKEVQEGFECGVSIANFKDYAEGDRIEVYEIQ